MDEIITIGSSQVHHGKHNNRAYILSFSDNDSTSTVDIVEVLSRKQGYSKIVAKSPNQDWSFLKAKNLRKRAR